MRHVTTRNVELTDFAVECANVPAHVCCELIESSRYVPKNYAVTAQEIARSREIPRMPSE